MAPSGLIRLGGELPRVNPGLCFLGHFGPWIGNVQSLSGRKTLNSYQALARLLCSRAALKAARGGEDEIKNELSNVKSRLLGLLALLVSLEYSEPERSRDLWVDE
jgi:hypothetical protein